MKMQAEFKIYFLTMIVEKRKQNKMLHADGKRESHNSKKLMLAKGHDIIKKNACNSVVKRFTAKKNLTLDTKKR